MLYFVSCFFTFGVPLPHVYKRLYFRLYFVSCLFLFSVFAAVAVFRKTFSSQKCFFSPGFSDEFDGFDDDVDLLTLEVSRGPTILARFFWKLIRPPSELLLF